MSLLSTKKIPFDPVVNNTSGSTVGYKYLDFSRLAGKSSLELICHVVPEGIDGEIRLLAGSPFTSRGGKEIGSFRLTSDMPREMTEIRIPLSGLEGLDGKQALYFLFGSNTKETSICELHDFRFAGRPE